MKKCFKQHLSVLLAAATMGVSLFGNVLFATPVMAAETTTATTAGKQTSTVTYEKSSTFSVTIPKTITIGDNIGLYDVAVKGDILTNQVLCVVPSESINMTTTDNLKNVTISVTQSKKMWTYQDLTPRNMMVEHGNGMIDGSNLSAGSWTGTLQFKISLITN